jgi:sulfonate transport system ATP-binding protein
MNTLEERPALLDAQVRTKRFGAKTVLADVEIAIAQGEIVALVGASGCGKSSLLRLIAGLDHDYKGSIRLDGRSLGGLTRDIGFVFQEPRLFPWLTVAENVAFDLGRAGRNDPRVTALLGEVGLAGRERALPKELSGGQAQRVAIARGLFTQPRLLLLDEPFSAVDAFTRMHLQDLLLSMAARHATSLLMVTHDIDEACFVADRVLVLEASPGRVRDEIAVPLARPRDRGDARLAAIKSQVLQALHLAHALDSPPG